MQCGSSINADLLAHPTMSYKRDGTEPNILQVYDNIASHFSGTRHSQWPRVAEFMDSLQPGSVLVDIGCGNGKYLTPAPSQQLYKVREATTYNSVTSFTGVGSGIKLGI